jgi:hypothetical protein
MREISPTPPSVAKPWIFGLLFVAGLSLGVGLCKVFWPSERVREVDVVRYVERRVEVPVEKIVERVVEKRVEVPVVKEVIRYVDRTVEAKSAQVADGPSRYELEDWAKLRRNMNKDTVRVLVGDPLRVSGSGQETWTFPFSGSATFTSEGKLESWQAPSASPR